MSPARCSINPRLHPDRPFLAIGAVILRDEEVLLVQRGNDPWKGWWSIPGGVVETGELLHDAVRREMREETGLLVEPLAVIEIFESIRPGLDGIIAFHYVVIDYICRLVGGDLAPADDASAAQWFHRERLPNPITAGAPDVIAKAFAWAASHPARDTLEG